MRPTPAFRRSVASPKRVGWWGRARILPLIVALVATQSIHVAPTFAVIDGFYVPSDNQAFENVALFDSETTTGAHWPCESDASRRNLSEVGTFVRSLGEGSSTAYGVDGRGCQLINSSASGTSWHGWMYPAINNGVADFNGGRTGTGDPRHADTCYAPNPTPMGAGKVRIVGDIEKPPTGLGFSASVTLSAHPGQCVTEGTLASYTIASIPGQQAAATRTFDVTVDIPAGTRNLALTIRGGEPRCTTEGGNCGVYVPSLRMYASLGADAPDPQLPTPLAIPDEQSYGLGSGHGNVLNRFESDPVNTATGNYVYSASDLTLPGRGLNLAFTRSYNSLDAGVGSFGPGWRHAYHSALGFEAGGVVRFTAEDGAQYLYQPDGSGGYVRPTAGHSTLAALGDGTYQLTRRDQVNYHFAADGRLLELADRNGNALTFSYTGNLLTTITDTVGRTVALGYDANDRLASLSGPPSRSVTYAYDAAGRLATVTDVLDGVWQYGYDSSGRLTTMIDPNNHTLVTNTYGTDGRVSSQTNAVNQTGLFDWDPVTDTSTYTDARGGVWTDVYRRNVLRSSSDPLGHTTRYAYDAAGNRMSVTDPRGNTTNYTYDAAGNVLTRTAPAPLSYVETWTYTARNDVATYTDGRNDTTAFTYDANGNLSQVDAPLAATTSYIRDPAGTGLLLSSTDPRSKTTGYGYDAEANLTSVTSPLGNVTTMTYDPAGRMLTIVDPRGKVTGANPADYTTTLTYDAADRLLTASDALDNVTTSVYDPAGNLLSVTDPNLHATTYAYDNANRLTSVTDAAAEVTAYAYDDVGNLLTRTDANDHVTTYGYDLANHLTSSTDPLGNDWTMTYDAAGNMATRTDANGQTTAYTHDELSRLLATTYADPGTPDVTVAYDANGNLTAMTDDGNETYAYDDLNRLTGVTRGSDAFGYGYDLASNLTSRTYPGGSTTIYTFDDDGRMATAVADATTTSYGYDPAANLTSIATPDGYAARYAYDRAARLLEVVHRNDAELLSRFSYTLDPAGNRIAMSTRTGTVSYRYDTLDRLTGACWATTCPWGAGAAPAPCLDCGSAVGVSRPADPTPPDPADPFVTYTYDPVGNRLSEATSAGTATFSYDVADRLTSRSGGFPGSADRPPTTTSGTWSSGASGYTSDNAYATVAPAKNTTRAQRYGGFGFSAIPAGATIDRVTVTVEWAVSSGSAQATLAAQAASGGTLVGTPLTNTSKPTTDTVQSFEVAGLTRTQLAGAFEVEVRATRGGGGANFTARLDQVRVAVEYTTGAQSFTYDANGNQLSAGPDTFAWDAADRLTSATVAGTTETYAYAGDGRRLSATAAGATTNWLWDLNFGLPQLALERTAAGAVVRRNTYGLGRIATIAGATTAYHHHDGLGSLVALTNPAGDPLAWSEYQPYGAVRTSGVATGAPSMPFGFTGEYSDPTGQLHLRARQYDPGTGRFLSTDPVASLLTDPYVGTYVYVRNRPTVAVDPSGEFLFVIALPALPAIAGAVVATAKVAAASAAVVGAALAGAHVGPALADFARPRYPESEPILDPRPAPDAGRFWSDLELIGSGHAYDVSAPGGGIPGGSWCARHRAVCTTGMLLAGGAVLWGATLLLPPGVGAATNGSDRTGK